MEQDNADVDEQLPIVPTEDRTAISGSPTKIISFTSPKENFEPNLNVNLGSQNAEDELISLFKKRNGNCYDETLKTNGPEELVLSSMTSLYDKDIKEMDTNRNRNDAFIMMESTGNNQIPNCVDDNNINDINYVDNTILNNSLYMSDGVRSVDYVLAWESNEHKSVEKMNINKRRTYENNLLIQGLEIEREQFEYDLNFVKIHAPIDVLRRYAEILKLRMPMKEIPGMGGARNAVNSLYCQLKGVSVSILNKILVDERNFPKKSQRFTAIYSRDKEYLFDIQQENFFTPAVRSRIVQFILDRQKFTLDNDDYAFGIERLVAGGIYLAGYPLHDGDLNERGCMRNKLNNEWASICKWYRYQPLDYIKEYFGVKIGLYFAWLGFYTYMLLLASIVGIICFLYSFLTLDDDIPTNQICSGNPDIKMCPLCDTWCDYWSLKETCFYAKLTYLIDNPTTVFFAVFMSFWATLFLELWKRYSSEITHRWDLTGFDVHEEHPRPQYLARLANVRKMKIDYVTNTKEPQPPFWRMKLPATLFSFSVVLLLIMLAFAAVLAVVLYRMSVLASLAVYKVTGNTSSAIMITTGTAACINLCMIFFFNYMYTYLAEYLTELELLRTQTEFDDSITLKIYLLQFVNYYASIFYIAFFKGKFVGHPGKYNRLWNFRQEECSAGGCLTELCIQLAIIMIGKQAVNSILEMVMPIFWKWINVMRVSLLNKSRHSPIKKKHKNIRWFQDLKLVEWGPRSLFPEYLEMVLQYGFVTIFVSAFPLAPLFALLNNILEMRLDAKKLLTHYRRPVSQRVKDIGVWYRILDSIGKLSVITNGFIIAFTSDFIPRLVYYYTADKGMTNYLNYTLTTFHTKHLDQPPKNISDDVEVCSFIDFRVPHTEQNASKRYSLTNEYFVILACRLAFVVLFENFVALVMIIVRWCIPDMNNELRDQIRREAYITNEIIIKQETIRARNERFENRESSNSGDSNVVESKIEKLMCTNLSQAELDLFVHGPGKITGVGGKTGEITMDTADTGPASF